MHPKHPTSQTCFTFLAGSLFEHATTSMRSCLNGICSIRFRGHARTSTYLADATRTLANIVDNFKPGETYNVGGRELHTIEELSDVILRVTG